MTRGDNVTSFFSSTYTRSCYFVLVLYENKEQLLLPQPPGIFHLLSRVFAANYFSFLLHRLCVKRACDERRPANPLPSFIVHRLSSVSISERYFWPLSSGFMTIHIIQWEIQPTRSLLRSASKLLPTIRVCTSGWNWLSKIHRFLFFFFPSVWWVQRQPCLLTANDQNIASEEKSSSHYSRVHKSDESVVSTAEDAGKDGFHYGLRSKPSLQHLRDIDRLRYREHTGEASVSR